MHASDSTIVLDKPHKPMSFGALMTLYESNYQCLMNLLQVHRQDLNEQEFTFLHKKHIVHCRVDEVTKYTALLCIDEDQISHGEPVRVNHFRVRIYHDARLAAVHSSMQDNSQYQLDEVPLSADRIQALWGQNMFFNKWLSYCLDRKLVKKQKISENTNT